MAAAQAAPAARALTAAPGAPTPPGMMPTHALVTATPAEVTTLVSDTLASPDDTPDRIMVQLDRRNLAACRSTSASIITACSM
ncbi:MAG: hypothetical protein R3C04_07765 [Hyphomonas sp.]